MDQIKEQRKLELCQQLSSRRETLNRSKKVVSQEFSLSHQLKRSVRNKPYTWFAGSLVTATAATLLLRSSKKNTKPRFGLTRWGFGIALGLAKPYLMKWAVNQAKTKISQKLTQPNPNS